MDNDIKVRFLVEGFMAGKDKKFIIDLQYPQFDEMLIIYNH